jgi:hypothetical protein
MSSPNLEIVTDGFYRLPHALFESEKIKQLSGETFRIYLWFVMRGWRFPDSTGMVRASISFVGMNLPVSPATIKRCFCELKRCGLLELIERNHREGNLWKVTDIFGLPGLTNGNNRCDRSKNTSKLKLCTTNGQNDKEANDRFEVFMQNLKMKTPFFFEYFSRMPLQYRKAERSSFLKLVRQYRGVQLEAAVIHLQATGTTSGAVCNCPLSYLIKLPEIELEKILGKPVTNKPEDQVRQSDGQNPEVQFDIAFPSIEQQNRYIESVAHKFPMARGSVKALRMLAIGLWFSQNSVHQ